MDPRADARWLAVYWSVIEHMLLYVEYYVCCIGGEAVVGRSCAQAVGIMLRC